MQKEKVVTETGKSESSMPKNAMTVENQLKKYDYPKSVYFIIGYEFFVAFGYYGIRTYYIHPHYDKSLIPKQYLPKINMFLIENLTSSGLEELDKFKCREGVFDSLYKKNISNPVLFWKTAEFYTSELSKFAVKLLKIPASTANLERMFSKWGLIHNSIRNRLSFEKSKKLMHLYVTLAMEDNYEEEDFDEENV